jgi:hypothetical protein
MISLRKQTIKNIVEDVGKRGFLHIVDENVNK